jgi:hypothetical protein
MALTCGVLAVSLFAIGCGGGDDTTETTASLTKAQFVKQGNAICENGNREIDASFEEFTKEHNLS